MDLIKQKIMGNLMSKFYLIFNILLLSHVNLIAQDTTKLIQGNLLESKESLMKINSRDNETRSPIVRINMNSTVLECHVITNC